MKACVGAVAVLAGLVGLLTQPLPSLRRLQVPLVASVEALIDQRQFSGDPPWVDFAAGGFLPVEPARNVPLTVKRGEIPLDLEGAYLRVGPSLGIFPATKRTHIFDGDGMVHSVRIKAGKAQYSCDYLETPRYLFEQGLGYEWFMRLGELHGWLGMLKLFTTLKAKAPIAGIERLEAGTANTAVGITPEGRVWALNEAGRPFRFLVRDDGSVESKGFDTLEGTLSTTVSAHPKYDYATGETFYHGRELMQYFSAGRIKGGKVVEEAKLPVKDGFQHDMFITQDYVVIVDGSSRFSPKNVAKKGPLWMFDGAHQLRFGVAPRSQPLSPESFKWIEAPFAAEIVHTCFGWNSGSTIHLFTPVAFNDPNATGGVLGGMTAFAMKAVTIDVASGKVELHDVEGGEEYSTEFCRVPDRSVGGQTRFAYSGLQGTRDDDGVKGFNFTGILKWDMLERKRVGVIHLPPGAVGGEPVHVPGAGEGFLSMFVWNTATTSSTFALYDATSFSAEPQVELQVPRRVPLGFHGWWLTEQDLARQQ